MTGSANAPLREGERALRRRLGIPQDAPRVLVLAESSHWDPDWLLTSREYFRWLVRPNLERAIDELLRDPRRVYSVECIFFLRMFWDRRPERRGQVRALVNERRLRLSGSGVTTADTLIPPAEAILRDFLVGQEWLRRNGMTQEPRVAYFPDSFGHSPALPSILRAAGFDGVAVTRIDGMFFAGTGYDRAERFPLEGSSAALLLCEKRSLDFVWRGKDGAEVLAHWNAFGYGQGDLIAHHGISRLCRLPLALPDRSRGNVARRIRGYVAELGPLSTTPYLFCPIGMDFAAPIRDLCALLDRYNELDYPASGVFAVNAGLDDYLELVSYYRERLPVVELDPNPCFMGFYASRPSLKKRCRELVEALLLAERLALRPGNERALAAVGSRLEEAWYSACAANHHDFVTGTSPDRVVRKEQGPWLRKGAEAAAAAIREIGFQGAKACPADSPRAASPPAWRREGRKVIVETADLAIEADEQSGGGIVRAWRPSDGAPLLEAVSNDLVAYFDSGGLWRMGHEYRGGTFREVARAGRRAAEIEVRERGDLIELESSFRIGGEKILRRVLVRRGAPEVRFRLEGRAPPGHTLAVRFATGIAAASLVTDVPGGLAVRPAERHYSPTFWPAQQFAAIEDRTSGRFFALLFEVPGAVALRPGGRLEAVVLRNATHERAFGFLPIPAMPASGRERARISLSYAVAFAPFAAPHPGGIPLRLWWGAGLTPEGALGAEADLWDEAAAVVRSEPPEVTVAAVKPASRGEGIVVRLLTFSAAGRAVRLEVPGRVVRAAFLCDARERDLGPLQVEAGAVRLEMPGNIATVRIIA